MRGALNFLLAIAVLLCGVHVAEPVQAHPEAAHHALEMHAHDAPGDESRKGAAEATHAVHHHCPMAPDQNGASVQCDIRGESPLLFPARAEVLGSLSQAPPEEPPAV